MRARCEPRQRWNPLAKPMWGFGARSKSTVSGRGTLRIEVGRCHEMSHPEPARTSPLGSHVPRSGIRPPSVTGDSKRISSSTANGHSDGSATTSARCSGWREVAEEARQAAATVSSPAIREAEDVEDVLAGQVLPVHLGGEQHPEQVVARVDAAPRSSR